VTREEWQEARDKLLRKEKAATRAHDKLAAERRRLPMVAVEKDYVFTGPNGRASLLDLFEGRRQLIIYHFMFAPDVDGWPAAGCPGCSMVVDYIGPLAHLHARDTSLALVSLAPLANIEAYRRRMGWTLPWFSSEGTEFNKDFGVTTPEGETFGLSTFLRVGGDVFHTYFTTDRGLEAVDTNFTLLDWTPLGRQEKWEDSPAGWPKPRLTCGGVATMSIESERLQSCRTRFGLSGTCGSMSLRRDALPRVQFDRNHNSERA
jgi:predicted dithiol-disulfide oxidoreductase (DUF899 family)